ncbi:hypothetical protein Dsin_006371 [Dipteronia sinensis]|uniref:non-specific serine/threonine protein kinase n=1 Tax=Dipteronia sinensis TaxID=43782 RepID=A0AAE0EFT6_9ROSI|nr:hypothetical protein Dsin_006371 [Dipteronia sinensis]
MHFLTSSLLFSILLLLSPSAVSGFGSMGPISASFGLNSFFCAIDASGKQDVVCWAKNISSISSPSSSSNSAYFSSIPAMAALCGGDGFLCSILANTSQPFCWASNGSGTDLVPSVFKSTAYSHIAAGKSHVCAIRGSYYSDHDWGTVDCWEIVSSGNNSLKSVQSSVFYDENVSNHVFENVVSGEGFSCGGVREGGVVCWGPESGSVGVFNVTDSFKVLASGRGSLCGILEVSGEVRCWGKNDSIPIPPAGIRFVSLSAGANHFCGIREDNHGAECWGSYNFSSVPKISGFVAIASSDFTTCGIRENDLVLDCWFANASSRPDYDPPLELFSPGLCSPGPCRVGEFAFNASILNEPDLTSLCVMKDLRYVLLVVQIVLQDSSCLVHVPKMLIGCARLALFARIVLVGKFVGSNHIQRSIGISFLN